MDFEFSPFMAYAAKAVAAVVALVTAYGAKGDGVRAFFQRLMPKRSRVKAADLSKDGAWRVLMDDSLERQCLDSVDLLNAWMACRTTGQLGKKPKQAEPAPAPAAEPAV